MKNVCMDYIFPSILYTMDLEGLDNSEIIKDCLQIKENTDTVKLSNMGGWQSPVICEDLKTLSLKLLEKKVEEAVQFALNNQEISDLNFEFSYWININNSKDYNVMHNHGTLLICAVYYPFIPKIPKDCGGELVFTRTDGGSYFNLHKKHLKFSVSCRTGMLAIFSPHLFHHVTPTNSEENRISIAFNVEIKK
jgi:uncharacterized protein (TIGR02466 family)